MEGDDSDDEAASDPTSTAGGEPAGVEAIGGLRRELMDAYAERDELRRRLEKTEARAEASSKEAQEAKTKYSSVDRRLKDVQDAAKQAEEAKAEALQAYSKQGEEVDRLKKRLSEKEAELERRKTHDRSAPSADGRIEGASGGPPASAPQGTAPVQGAGQVRLALAELRNMAQQVGTDPEKASWKDVMDSMLAVYMVETFAERMSGGGRKSDSGGEEVRQLRQELSELKRQKQEEERDSKLLAGIHQIVEKQDSRYSQLQQQAQTEIATLKRDLADMATRVEAAAAKQRGEGLGAGELGQLAERWKKIKGDFEAMKKVFGEGDSWKGEMVERFFNSVEQHMGGIFQATQGAQAAGGLPPPIKPFKGGGQPATIVVQAARVDMGEEEFRRLAEQVIGSEEGRTLTEPVRYGEGIIVAPPRYADDVRRMLSRAGVPYYDFKGYVAVHPRFDGQVGPLIKELPDK